MLTDASNPREKVIVMLGPFLVVTHLATSHHILRDIALHVVFSVNPVIGEADATLRICLRGARTRPTVVTPTGEKVDHLRRRKREWHAALSRVISVARHHAVPERDPIRKAVILPRSEVLLLNTPTTSHMAAFPLTANHFAGVATLTDHLVPGSTTGIINSSQGSQSTEFLPGQVFVLQTPAAFHPSLGQLGRRIDLRVAAITLAHPGSYALVLRQRQYCELTEPLAGQVQRFHGILLMVRARLDGEAAPFE
jgi:hypothetical protein